MKRPAIVTFNAILNLVIGLFFTLLNVVQLFGSNPHQGGSPWNFWEWDPDVVKIIGPLTVLSVASIFVFFGLWRLKPWGRSLFNVVNLLIGVVLLGMAVSGGVTGYEIEGTQPRVIVALVSLIFLSAPLGMAKPHVKEAFKG